MNIRTNMNLSQLNNNNNAHKHFKCTVFISNIMSDPKYELIVTILGALNLICISIRDFQLSQIARNFNWPTAQVIINAFFLIEMMIDFSIHGKKSFKKSFRVWPESICQLINIYATTLYFIHFKKLSQRLTGNLLMQDNYDPNSLIKLFELIIFIRISKVLTLLYEIKAMRLVIETMRNMISPMLQLMGVLFVLFYIFSIIGMALFGGLTKQDFPSIVKVKITPSGYYM